MKLKVKTINKDRFYVEVTEEETIKQVKQKLVDMKPDMFNLEGMKLIYQGKMMDNDKKLVPDYNVKETEFIVATCTIKKAPKEDPGLKTLMDMGFDKAQATETLKAAGGNPDVAAQLLMGADDDTIPQSGAAAGAGAPATRETHSGLFKFCGRSARE